MTHQAVLLLQAPLAHASQPEATLGQLSSKAQAPARSTVRAMASASNGADVPAGKEMAILVRDAAVVQNSCVVHCSVVVMQFLEVLCSCSLHACSAVVLSSTCTVDLHACSAVCVDTGVVMDFCACLGCFSCLEACSAVPLWVDLLLPKCQYATLTVSIHAVLCTCVGTLHTQNSC
jgi:hypothetical protein